MAYTSNCSFIGQTYATGNGSFGAYETVSKYAGANSSNYYAYVMQFQTGDFTGISEKLDLILSIKSQYHANINLRYALATSDANRNSYRSTYAEVADDNQIASGLFALTNLSTSTLKTYTLSIDTDVLEPNTTYYLFLWGSNNASFVTVGATETHTGTVTYTVTHTVTYNANGHGTAPSAQTVADGESITLPTLTAEGFNFLGWSTSASATSGMTGTYKPTASVTLYAVWKAAGSYIYYNNNGTAVKCELYYNDNGNAVRCELYYNDNGTAVKM